MRGGRGADARTRGRTGSAARRRSRAAILGPSVIGAAIVAACVGAGDHERQGDRRYAERAWSDALAEYRLAARQRAASAELEAKIAMAALHAADPTEAARAWRALAAGHPDQRDLAAEGLVRTARAAVVQRDVAGLRAAVQGLREIAPQRIAELGGGLLVALDDTLAPGDTDLALAAAAASQGPVADSLVAAWADASSRAGRCDLAARAYDALRRRNATPAIARTARRGLAACDVEAGRAALAAGQLDQAEAAFRAAIAIGVPDSLVRLAWLLVGDARWAAGDTAVAVEAYRKATLGADEDSPVARRAREQLNRLLGNPATP